MTGAALVTSEDGSEEGGEKAASIDGEVEDGKELWNEMFLEDASRWGRG